MEDGLNSGFNGKCLASKKLSFFYLPSSLQQERYDQMSCTEKFESCNAEIVPVRRAEISKPTLALVGYEKFYCENLPGKQNQL